MTNWYSCWYLIYLFPIVHSYLFGCYYDYGQPLVLPEQLPIDVCTHILVIGPVFVQDRNVTIIERSYSGLRALQSMRDYRARHTKKLKVIPSIIGGDDEWKKAINDTESQVKFANALVQFAQAEVGLDCLRSFQQRLTFHRISMDWILIGNIPVGIIKLFTLNLFYNFVWQSIKRSVVNFSSPPLLVRVNTLLIIVMKSLN